MTRRGMYKGAKRSYRTARKVSYARGRARLSKSGVLHRFLRGSMRVQYKRKFKPQKYVRTAFGGFRRRR